MAQEKGAAIGGAGFDARFETPPDRQRLVGMKPVASDLGIHDALLVAPGHRDRSMVYQRMSRRQDVFNMPPLGSQVSDRAALDVLGRWIDSLDYGGK